MFFFEDVLCLYTKHQQTATSDYNNSPTLTTQLLYTFLSIFFALGTLLVSVHVLPIAQPPACTFSWCAELNRSIGHRLTNHV